MNVIYDDTLELENEVPDEVDRLDEMEYEVAVKVVGVGGGGGNAIEYMAHRHIEGVEYVVVNTDVPALRKKDKKLMRRLQIGKKRTKGRGAGGNPQVGCESATEDRANIEKVLEGTTMAFISAGMGGGTGTGAAPVIAEIARSMGILTIGVVTKPFDFERQQKMNAALKGIAEMRKHVDALIIIPNQKLLAQNEQALSAKDAFEKVDDVLYTVVKCISEILSTTSYMNVDFADLESVLKDAGDAHIAIGVATGDNKAEEAVCQVVNSPLLETSIKNAGKVLVHIAMSDDVILSDVDTIADMLTKAAHPDVDVIVGCNLVSDLKDTVQVVAVATCFMDGAGGPQVSGEDPWQSKQQTPPTAPQPPRRPGTEPIQSGNTQQLQEVQSMFPTPRGEPQDSFITQNLDSRQGGDPFRALEDIFNS